MLDLIQKLLELDLKLIKEINSLLVMGKEKINILNLMMEIILLLLFMDVIINI